MTGGFDGNLQGTPLVAPPSNPSLEVGEVPTAAGYALMTQIAQTAIANLTAKLKSGYLQDMTLVTPDNPYPYANQNSVGTGQILQFTPVGQYSDGSTQPQLNSSFAGRGVLGHRATLRRCTRAKLDRRSRLLQARLSSNTRHPVASSPRNGLCTLGWCILGWSGSSAAQGHLSFLYCSGVSRK